MIYGLFSIRDAKTGFMTPVIEANDAAAIRNFYHTVRNSEGILYSYAQDFSLYRIANFDADSGVVTTISPVQWVADGSSALADMKE